MDATDTAIVNELRDPESGVGTPRFAEELMRAVRERTGKARKTFYRHVKRLTTEGIVDRIPYGSAVQYQINEPYPGFLDAVEELEGRMDRIRKLALAGKAGDIYQRVMDEILFPAMTLVLRGVVPPDFLEDPGAIDLRRTRSSVGKWAGFIRRVIVDPVMDLGGGHMTAREILDGLKKKDPTIARLLDLSERPVAP